MQRPILHLCAAAGLAIIAAGCLPDDARVSSPPPPPSPPVQSRRSGDVLWMKRFGGLGEQGATGASLDASSVWVGGSFQEGIDVGGVHLHAAGENDAFVARLGRDGEVRWAKRFGGARADSLCGVAADHEGGAYVAGNFIRDADVDGTIVHSLVPEAQAFDLWLARLDGEGHPRWVRRLGSTVRVDCGAIAADPTGGVAVAGAFEGSLDPGSGQPLRSAGGSDIFVARYDAEGKLAFIHRYGDAHNRQWGTTVAVDPGGRVLASGMFDGVIDFGGGLRPSTGWHSIFVVALDPGGKHLWDRVFGGAKGPAPLSMDVDRRGEILLAGLFSGELRFDPTRVLPEPSQGDRSFVARLDRDGAPRWARAFNGGFEPPVRAASSGDGAIYLAGPEQAPLDLTVPDPPTAPKTLQRDVHLFAASLSADGTQRWIRRFGADGDRWSAVAADDAGVVLAGAAPRMVDLGGGRVGPSGDVDALVVGLAP